MQKTVVYLDVLFFINLFINYFLLLATMKIGSRRTSRVRLLLSSLLGAFYSVIIFFPQLPPALMIPVRLLMSATMILAAFRFVSLKAYLKLLLYFFAVNFAFAGCTLAIWYLMSPNNMLYQNGVLYVDISVSVLIFTTIGAYLILFLVSRHLKKDNVDVKSCQVTVRMGQREVSLNGFVDTGNKLTDLFSGTPVAVCPYEKIASLLPAEFKSFYSDMEHFLKRTQQKDTADFYKRLRIVPYKGVDGGGVLPAFRPDRFAVETSENEQYIEIEDVLIAVAKDPFADKSCEILLGPSMYGLKPPKKKKSYSISGQ